MSDNAPKWEPPVPGTAGMVKLPEFQGPMNPRHWLVVAVGVLVVGVLIGVGLLLKNDKSTTSSSADPAPVHGEMSFATLRAAFKLLPDDVVQGECDSIKIVGIHEAAARVALEFEARGDTVRVSDLEVILTNECSRR